MATRSARDNKALNARHAEVLKAMLRQPENKLCADCKRNDPRWASTNLGCFMCIRCSGIHRSMGVHITRIKSIDLDTWTPEQVACVQRWGNKRANAYWEAHLRPGHMPPDHKIESFIRSKYESKRWAMEGPLPEPETLDDDKDVAPAPPTAVSQNAAPSHPTISKVTPPTMSKPATSASATNNPLDFFDSPNDQPVKTTSGPASVKVVNNVQPSVGGGLFDLDFSPQASAAAVTATAPAGRKDVKNDILSLFAVKPQQSYTNPIAQAPNINAVNNQFNGLNFGASNTMPQVNNVNNPSNLSQNNSFGDGNNVWASPADQLRQQSQDPFGSFTSGTTSTNGNNKDVFSDIWS
ncbi:hypothetical protein PGT21_014061 [Puccinia graminis f. sp. tritici]|uniref:Arf-GAP domain-containing protein n=1 Tax=Puccinia graminis f. sp. tritici TaxID=56615 RepID=A0A5B0LIP0_PUCGR|nr:hypothetical protein PGTUg99_011257 [Puccinia graminis f. sp. tritici]KAA1092783.1 hypothetical protein PGT21_014061 [Puccinia graminis f. sp. tritici]